ncbi:hypothetical protein [Streptomyces sp. NPDC002054]|uniref:hypothetical protein n=1 Tax=Streptomyces sp. NPDC002054 TaxID=3154663 RepID=UPI003330CD52
MDTAELLRELELCMAELSTPMRVYVVSGRFSESEADLPELADGIRALLVGAVFGDAAWERFLRGVTPLTAREIANSLEPMETCEAAAFLAGVASVDLLWPGRRLAPPEVALRAANRVVSAGGRSPVAGCDR